MGDNEGRRFHRPQMRALRMASAELSTIAGVPQIGSTCCGARRRQPRRRNGDALYSPPRGNIPKRRLDSCREYRSADRSN
jgi:hypothetical protein